LRREAQYGTSEHCAEPHAGSSSIPARAVGVTCPLTRRGKTRRGDAAADPKPETRRGKTRCGDAAADPKPERRNDRPSRTRRRPARAQARSRPAPAGPARSAPRYPGAAPLPAPPVSGGGGAALASLPCAAAHPSWRLAPSGRGARAGVTSPADAKTASASRPGGVQSTSSGAAPTAAATPASSSGQHCCGHAGSCIAILPSSLQRCSSPLRPPLPPCANGAQPGPRAGWHPHTTEI